MTGKPSTIQGYGGDSLVRVRSTCLYVATRLGDLLDDIVVVGGLVPSLLVDQQEPVTGLEAHAGTLDLDMGLALAILHEERYLALGERLRDAGFEPDTNESGNRTLQRWRTGFSPSVTIDFLIPPSDENDVGGTQRHILPDFAAVITPGLHLAFADRVRVPIEGSTPSGEEAGRDMWVCGPGAFTVLKALAFRNRGDNKDAYDMVYVWQGVGIESVVGCLEPVVDDRYVAQALDIIRADFGTIDSIGPRRTAEFMRGMPDDDIQADAVGLADRLLTQLSGVG